MRLEKYSLQREQLKKKSHISFVNLSGKGLGKWGAGEEREYPSYSLHRVYTPAQNIHTDTCFSTTTSAFTKLVSTNRCLSFMKDKNSKVKIQNKRSVGQC